MLRLRRARLRLGVLRRLGLNEPGGADAGFTLVEVIVAITILTIVSLFSAQLVQTSIRTSDNLNRYQTAVSVATMQMEAVRGVNPGTVTNPNDPDGATSALFIGRPRSAQLALFNTGSNKAAAYVASIVNNTYPEWDPNIPDGITATADATIPPTGVDSALEADGASVIYRDLNGNRVYPTSVKDSFGTTIWSTDAAGTNRIQATYTLSPAVQSGPTYTYTEVAPTAGVPLSTTVAPTAKYPSSNPTNNAIIQSTVFGYPSGEVSLNGTTYTTTIILGSCFIHTSATLMSASSVSGACGKADSVVQAAGYSIPVSSTTCAASPAACGASALPSAIGSYTKLIRAMVVVQWSGSSTCTTANPCMYALTGEFLPGTNDLFWEAPS